MPGTADAAASGPAAAPAPEAALAALRQAEALLHAGDADDERLDERIRALQAAADEVAEHLPREQPSSAYVAPCMPFWVQVLGFRMGIFAIMRRGARHGLSPLPDRPTCRPTGSMQTWAWRAWTGSLAP